MRPHFILSYGFMENKKKTLILYTSVGLGHKFIAENIGWHLEQAGFKVKLADIGKVQKGKFEHVVVGLHQFINKHLPFVWGFIYRWGHYVILPFRTTIAGFNYKSTKTLVDEFQPDLIITTQTTASAVAAYLKKKALYKNLFAIAFSDYHLHPYWLYSQADFYLANTQEQKEEMIKQGVEQEEIFVCGITLKQQVNVDKKAIKEKFGIAESESVVLIGTGSLGIGFNNEDLQKLTKLQNTKIIFACGKNEQLFQSIKNLKYPSVIPLDFYQPMDDLYSVADIFIGKPGGLSTAESLRWNLPLLVSFVLPGQEEKNLKYLLDKKLVMVKTGDLLKQTSEELRTHSFKKSLENNPALPKLIYGEIGVAEAVIKFLGQLR